MTTIKNPDIQQLFEAVQAGYTMPITLEIADTVSGQLSHDQSQETLQPDGSLRVTISDATNVDYTLSHELMHMWLTSHDYPQLQYHLLTGDPAQDRQLYAVSSALYGAALHVPVVAWQQAHRLLTGQVIAQLEAGFAANVPAETPAGDQLLVFRVVSLLDLLVTLSGGSGAQQAGWAKTYPAAYPVAKRLYDGLMTKPLDSPFSLRRAAVNLFGAFSQWLAAAGYAPLPLGEFVTVPPVLSQRQLRLQLNQVFELKHSDYRDVDSKAQGYVALGADGQNAFTLPLTNPSAPFFQHLYTQSVQAVLTQYHLDYTVRE
ncbi:hypothetical protein [Lacticaseibacillus nasuensis]|uniref:IpaB EvcA family protein n=1 Tax=Lacticaseibacillus nasuensis JCM 17158 TaxID=1291734 RepID=A0A0R1JUP2_9LACO|nr:hypothetical protein [Lacticaseibacillus nasuensis]KRK70455.1 hypothetical protein FD02_GL000521 [Lacticaseibacillus nasuensis JCM 17158]